MKNPTLTIDFGSMFSGKSQELVRRCSKLTDSLASVHHHEGEIVESVLLIVDKNQVCREVESQSKGLTSHASNFRVSKYLQVREVVKLGEITDEDIQHVTFIGIDEAFYPDLYEKVLYWFLEKRISISIASIDGSYEQKPISEDLFRLIPYATKIIKHSAFCHFCLQDKRHENAYYTIKWYRDGNERNEVDYGGKDKYKPVCLTHLLEFRECGRYEGGL